MQLPAVCEHDRQPVVDRPARNRRRDDDPVVSRSITIRLERKRRDETVEKFRLRRITADAEPIRTRLERVLPQLIEALREITEADPAMPAGLSDRAEDVWEPLVAIADLAGDNWPERARTAAVQLSAERREDEDSTGVQLLRDIRAIIDERRVNEISSSDLAFALNAIEASPWGGWAHDRGLSTHSLAKQLKRYKIKPRHLRDGSARGYSKDQFDEVFMRYLPPSSARSVKASDELLVAEVDEQRGNGAGPKNPDIPTRPEDRSDALTLPTAGANGPPPGLDKLGVSGDESADDEAYADAEFERLQRKFPGLFGSATRTTPAARAKTPV